jgi:hypothetical protein
MKAVKKLLYLALFLILLAVAALFFIDTLAKSAIEKGGTYATGVETTVGTARIGLFSGAFKLEHLVIANPPGYGADPFFRLDRLETGVTPASLSGDLVELPKLEIDGVVVRLANGKDGKPNYAVITDHLKKLSGSSPASEEKSGKKFVIRELIVRNVKIAADLSLLLPLPPGAAPELALPELRMKDVGTGGSGGGSSLSELAGIVLTAVLNAAGGASGFLDPSFAKDLSGRIADLGPLKDQALSAVNQALGGAVNDLGSQVGGEAQKALEKVGGLLGGKK